ncbi:hypothetical protein G6O69_09080 [Pseudenhygromyxa sp. WMMC2535]|uniref:hypothetical protein n=1 Tax=Pseudenhygromyxa sp. WMMC2535 TaxID=2712867 RepID=UPI0015548BE6|nr:hypothetical protein [Pseudenhygromyxa sp. WMMC2535]NVB37984.1 hypothetical protein [Pseudenhygromyxa sp. WMMC2535]
MEASVEVEEPEVAEDQFYRHSKRESWGVAVFLWERDEKRAFRFADGEVRVFKKGFYELMVPTEAPGDGSAAQLRAQVNNAGSKKALPSVGDQLVFLLANYPKGFTGEAWLEKHRGEGRRLKRHRDPAIAEARELLAHDTLAQLADAGDHEEIMRRWIDVLAGTDLAPSSHLAKLKSMPASADTSAALVEVTRDPGQDGALRRLQVALVGARGPATSWQVLTGTLALLAPVTHLCVRPSVFSTQGSIVIPNFKAPSRPNEASYQRYLEVARLVTEELTELGHAPADMFDLYDFAWVTLRPAALKSYGATKPSVN